MIKKKHSKMTKGAGTGGHGSGGKYSNQGAQGSWVVQHGSIQLDSQSKWKNKPNNLSFQI